MDSIPVDDDIEKDSKSSAAMIYEGKKRLDSPTCGTSHLPTSIGFTEIIQPVASPDFKEGSCALPFYEGQGSSCIIHDLCCELLNPSRLKASL